LYKTGGERDLLSIRIIQIRMDYTDLNEMKFEKINYMDCASSKKDELEAKIVQRGNIGEGNLFQISLFGFR